MMTKWGIAATGVVVVLAFLTSRTKHRRRLGGAWVMLLLALLCSLYADRTSGVWPRVASWGLMALAGIRIAQLVASELLKGRLSRSLILSDLAATAGYVGVLVWTLIHFGVNVSGLFATSAVLTAVVGLSLQDIILNVASGLFLQLEGNLRDGLWIQTDREPGCILELRARHTRVETADGDYLVIPNSLMLRSTVRVLALSRRHKVTFTVSYEHSPAAVTAAVQEALRASSIADVASTPEPQCFVAQFHAGHIEYGIYIWVSRPGHSTTQVSTVLTRTWFALRRMGVTPAAISQPVDLHTELERDRPGPASEARIALLSNVDLFHTLNHDELTSLAGRLQELEYAPGECILRQGQNGESMFVILQGTVRVLFQHESGHQETLATLEPGQFFGEMSLLTGAPRTATILAATEVDCMKIEKADLAMLFEVRPQLAEEISAVLAERQATLSTLQENFAGQTSSRAMRLDLLGRIERFFGFGGAD